MKIKKNTLLVLFSFMLTTGFSQQFIGFNVDNYAGVNGVTENPAYLAASKYKVYVNLAAFNVLGGNNAYDLERKRMFDFNFSNLREGNGVYKDPNTDKKYLYFNSEVLGPSFMINVGAKSGVGIYTRLRVLSREDNLSNSSFRLLGNSDPSFYNLNIQEQNVQMKVHSFGEVGVSFGRILLNNGAHFIKAGITGKYIMGIGAGYAHSDKMLVNIAPTKTINNLNGDFTLQYSASLDELQKNNFADVINKSTNKGWGLDLGVEYEWRPGTASQKKDWLLFDVTPYKLRFSLSVTDIGKVAYDNSTHGKSYLLNGNGHPTSDLAKTDNENYDQYFSRLQTQNILVPVSLQNKLNVSLPMAIRANVDYHIFKRIFINANTLVNLIGNSSQTPGYVTTFAVTPRIEKKWFSIYSPVSYNMEKQLNWGAGFRAGPLFAGSGSILSNFISKKDITAADFHIGLSVPIFQHGVFKKKKEEQKEEEEKKEEVKKEIIKKEDLVKDRDHDGVTDDKDDCPDSAGVVALNGCPDRDGDGIADKDDKCPDTVGVAKYQGCPIPDSDGDGVNDDEDKCPNSKGDSTNKGCPVIKKELMSKVSATGKKIYFASGKTYLLRQSFPKLNELARILKSDASLRLVVEGHSDNIGTDERNAMFSSGRANAVKDYLVGKGISPDRIDAIGYGASRPIADNNTFDGRCKNRRVEMHLVNYKE